MISSQMLKGTLEGCILAIISKKETYGYEISQNLNEYGFGKIAEGTIYPLLLRLEKNGFILATYRQSDQGPKRKYYSLTDKGTDEYLKFIESYIELTTAVNTLLNDK
ncbi:PadR family transcriptional regulator [Clostridium nigeriense]|uniref:PadR family transcriptional regulator n=1 Tax=Clostridium nigeriense TaxID=1805470 RepID=UPI003D33B5EA